MKNFLNTIAGLPILQRIGIAFLLIALAVFSFWHYLYSDVTQEEFDLTEKIADLNNSVSKEKKVARNLEKFQAEAKVQDDLLNEVLRELPDRKQIEGFLRSISVLAKDTGLEVLEFTPEAEVRRDFFADIPVKMTLEGTFHQLITFFDEVAHLPRIVNLSGVNIAMLREARDQITLKVDCTATTFRYLDEGERVVAKSEDSGKRRRR